MKYAADHISSMWQEMTWCHRYEIKYILNKINISLKINNLFKFYKIKINNLFYFILFFLYLFYFIFFYFFCTYLSAVQR